ncbi:F-box protein At1g30790-like isoform X2 [Solanum dulcamara]|nr:F-box protein At1g30790-like isoform X2 [Solanum dulcamara]
MSILSSRSPIFFPGEIIFEMLSYLPVKSLLRFKCVCKHWNDITQDFRFICLHYKRSPYYIGKMAPQSNTTTDEFKLLSSKGLILEYAIRPSHLTPSSPNLRYRIRNPEVHHQILEIPDSEKPILNMRMVFDTDNQILKLLSVVYDDELVGDQVIGYEVLDLLNEDSSYSWRPLNLPQQSRGETRICKLVKKHTNQIKLVFASGTAYSIWNAEAYSHLGIDILDMVNDSYIGHTTFPTSDFYTKNDGILWNEKLALAKIVKEELHVLVLDVYKKQIKWADHGKLIIKLPFLKELSVVPQIKLLYVSKTDKLYFIWRDKESICSFDITTGKLTTLVSSYVESQVQYITRPCLFTIKGMQSSSSQ